MNNILRFFIGCAVALLALIVVTVLLILLAPALIVGLVLGWGIVFVLLVVFAIVCVFALIWYLAREEEPVAKSTSYSIKQGKDKSNN